MSIFQVGLFGCWQTPEARIREWGKGRMTLCTLTTRQALSMCFHICPHFILRAAWKMGFISPFTDEKSEAQRDEELSGLISKLVARISESRLFPPLFVCLCIEPPFVCTSLIKGQISCRAKTRRNARGRARAPLSVSEGSVCLGASQNSGWGIFLPSLRLWGGYLCWFSSELEAQGLQSPLSHSFPHSSVHSSDVFLVAGCAWEWGHVPGLWHDPSALNPSWSEKRMCIENIIPKDYLFPLSSLIMAIFWKGYACTWETKSELYKSLWSQSLFHT